MKMNIDELIKILQQEKEKGAKNVIINGTLYTNDNFVILTNKPQW